MKMTIMRPDADRRTSICSRMEASFMREIALLKVRPAAGLVADRIFKPRLQTILFSIKLRMSGGACLQRIVCVAPRSTFGSHHVTVKMHRVRQGHVETTGSRAQRLKISCW